MIGFYDYTVILTYMSLASAVTGMGCAIGGHPIWATLCLLFCGLCDMFDGKVARTKKNRTEEEKAFGIQIDSLSDIVAFGVLPAVIAICVSNWAWYVCAVSAFYVLAGLIRLAYFNVTEELRQRSTTEVRKSYAGLPITSAALIFPTFYCAVAVYCMCVEDITILLSLFQRTLLPLLLTVTMLITGILFIVPIKVRKPGTRTLYLFLAIGLVLAAILGTVFLLKGNAAFFRR